MNVRVLLLLTACGLSSGCCIPGFLCNPIGPQCCSTGSFGQRPGSAANSATNCLPQYRSFHDDLATPRSQHPGLLSGYNLGGCHTIEQAPRFASPYCATPTVLQQPVCQPQAAYRQPRAVYSQKFRAPKTNQQQGWVWQWPWRWETHSQPARQPKSRLTRHSRSSVVNIAVPCACGSVHSNNAHSGQSKIPCQSCGCGCEESIRHFDSPPHSIANPAAVPPVPSRPNHRHFHGDQQDSATSKSETQSLNGPPVPAIDSTQQPTGPGSKPEISNPISPFEDLKSTQPAGSLPLEAESPQSSLWFPENSSFASSAHAERNVELRPVALQTGMNVGVESQATAPVIQQASGQFDQTATISQWEAIELKQAFFHEGSQAEHLTADEIVPVRRMITRRRQ